MPQINYREVGISNLDLIQGLWEKLNQHHGSKESCFQDHYENFTFTERKEVLLRKASGGDMRVDLAENTTSGILVGYCVSTVSSENEAEVDSIYVEEEYRSQGIGNTLMKHSLAWMEKKGVKSKKVRVAMGNQDSLSFYRHYGFRPRSIIREHTYDPDGSKDE
jgi:ribosomal protein S18 acetylase RimI-like enzyme